MQKIRKKINLLVISPRLCAGGEERDIVDLLKTIDRSRFELSLCLFDDKGEFRKELPSDLVCYDLRKKNRWDVLALSYRLSKVIDRVKPDVVLSSLWYATFIVSLARPLTRHRFKLVAREPHNHKQDCSGNDLKNYARRFCMDFGHKRSDRVIAVSRGAAEDIARSYGLEPEKVTFIYSSVDAVKVARLATDGASSRVNNRIVTLGRLVHRKGFDTLIRSFGIVKQAVRDAELLIIGEGPERTDLERLVKSEGLEGAVRITGFLENPYGEIASSGVFVCSSEWEGFGKVIIEAMICRTPVVSTRCNFGPEEIITDGIDGLLVPVGDVAAMAQAIVRLLNDERLRRGLCEGGLRRAGDFCIEKNALEHERIFREAGTAS